MNIYVKEALARIRREKICERRKMVAREVFLWGSESWSSATGNRTDWRLWSFSDEKINLFASENNLDGSRLIAGRIPHYRITEAEREKFISQGVEEKKPIGLADYEKGQEEKSKAAGIVPAGDGKFQCLECGGRDGWLPRAPGMLESELKNWRCVECKPWPSPAIVFKRCGPLWESSEADRVAREAIERANAAQEVVVAVEAAACVDCKGSWVIERPTLDGVEWLCWCCGKAIDKDVFSRAVNSRPPWRILQEARKLEASARMEAVRNGLGQELAGERRRVAPGG